MTTTAPPAAAVKIRLLQDAVYSEESDLWSTLLRYQAHIETYFRDIGLQLVLHPDDGFAYLRQISADDSGGIPPLFRRDRLTKGVAIMGVLLREQLLSFDEKVHDELQLLLRKDDILDLAAPFFPHDNDEIRAKRRVEAAFNKAEEMGLLRKRGTQETEECYEIRRIVKARFPAETLRELQSALQSHVDTSDSE
jgi:hypothetical protein